MRTNKLHHLTVCVGALSVFLCGSAAIAVRYEQVDIQVCDQETNEPVPCRIHLHDANGKPQRAEGLPFWHDHFVCAGSVGLKLPAGHYSYVVERGPEYRALSGSLTVEAGTPAQLALQIARLTNIAADGWWSGEMHVHRPIEDVELLMRSEDLHVAPVITWWNDRNLWSSRALPEQLLVAFDSDRYYHVMGGEDEREGGALLFFHLPRPLAITGAGREFPSPMRFLSEARQHAEAWIDIEKPFWWDVPVWIASGQVDSIGLANNHMCRDQMYEDEAWGRPRPTDRLPRPLGNGYWSQEIYYHILNCGLRLPPSAGSASGVLPNPVGYNRIYAYVPGEFSYERWWQAVKAGKSFVTNGPLLRVRANGQLPGHVFTVQGDALTLDLDISLLSRDPIQRVELVQNGRAERSISGEEFVRTGSLGPIEFHGSGWFLVRAIADNPKTFRFASTAPFYVEHGDTKRRVSRASAQFFVDWVRERMDRIKLDDADQREAVLRHHREAMSYWTARLAEANAD